MEFRVDRSSGLPPFRQIVQQVTEGLRLGVIGPGARLPVVREVVATSGVNANTVLKAYRELELRGLVEVRQGSGTFVTGATSAIDSAVLEELRGELAVWIERAVGAGLVETDLEALLRSVLIEKGVPSR